jgi:hypothetical protein
MRRYKFDHYICYPTARSLLRNYGTCYIKYVLNENTKKTMYVPYRKASKSFSHAEICSFVAARPLSVHDLTTPIHTSHSPSTASGIIS